MIVVTGAAGFIGSYFVGKLNRAGFANLVLVDRYDDPAKERNFQFKEYASLVDREDFFEWFRKNSGQVEMVFHLGARTDTIGQEPESYETLNLRYSQNLWKACTDYRVPWCMHLRQQPTGTGSRVFRCPQSNFTAATPEFVCLVKT